jgi:tetratricopeptide (TPR) repeat protein
MIPDKDKLESRITDVNKWIERSKSPELQFLLAYVYNQLGKTEQAKDMINAASEKLPDNEAVKTLKDVIENK